MNTPDFRDYRSAARGSINPGGVQSGTITITKPDGQKAVPGAIFMLCGLVFGGENATNTANAFGLLSDGAGTVVPFMFPAQVANQVGPVPIPFVIGANGTIAYSVLTFNNLPAATLGVWGYVCPAPGEG